MDSIGRNFKFGRGEGYGNFNAMMQICSARRTTQFEPLTSSIDAVLAVTWRIPLPGDLWGYADHFEKITNARAAKNAEQVEASWVNQTRLPFSIVSERSDDDFLMKLAAKVKNDQV